MMRVPGFTSQGRVGIPGTARTLGGACSIDGGEIVTPENVRTGRDNPGPGKLPEKIDQRRQLAAGQILVELDSNVATTTVPALTQRDLSQLQATVSRLDHGDTIGLAGLCRPRFYLKQPRLVCPGDQELEPAAYPDERAPSAPGQHVNTFGTETPARTYDPLFARNRGHQVRHGAMVRTIARRVREFAASEPGDEAGEGLHVGAVLGEGGSTHHRPGTPAPCGDLPEALPPCAAVKPPGR
jgi:hypothetical protein